MSARTLGHAMLLLARVVRPRPSPTTHNAALEAANMALAEVRSAFDLAVGWK